MVSKCLSSAAAVVVAVTLFGTDATAVQTGFNCSNGQFAFEGSITDCTNRVASLTTSLGLAQNSLFCIDWSQGGPVNMSWGVWGGGGSTDSGDDYSQLDDCNNAAEKLNQKLETTLFICASQILAVTTDVDCTAARLQTINSISTQNPTATQPVPVLTFSKMEKVSEVGQGFYCSIGQFAFGGDFAQCTQKVNELESFLGVTASSLFCVDWSHLGKTNYSWGVWGSEGSTDGDDYTQITNCQDAATNLNTKLNSPDAFICADEIIAVPSATICNALMPKLNDALYSSSSGSKATTTHSQIPSISTTFSGDYSSMTPASKQDLATEVVNQLSSRTSGKLNKNNTAVIISRGTTKSAFEVNVTVLGGALSTSAAKTLAAGIVTNPLTATAGGKTISTIGATSSAQATISSVGNNNNNNNYNGQEKLSAGDDVGIVIGVFAAIALAVVIGLFVLHRKSDNMAYSAVSENNDFVHPR